MGLQANLLGGQLADQYRNLGLLSSLGQQQQRLEQAQLDVDRAEFDRRIDDPFTTIKIFISSNKTNISFGNRQRYKGKMVYGFDFGDTGGFGDALSGTSEFFKGLFTA